MAGCRGSLCCCCRWCCCCGDRETRTPEELVRSGWSRAGEGAVAKGLREALPGGGPVELGPQVASGGAWAPHAGLSKHLPGFTCPSLGSFLISPPWILREDLGQLQSISSILIF